MIINQVKHENNNINLNIALTDHEFKERFIRCADCGEILFKEDAVDIDGIYFCLNCVVACDVCGVLIPADSSYHVADSEYHYCRHCYGNETYICEDCGSHFRYSDSLMNIEGCLYCDRCAEEHQSAIDSYHTFKDYGNIEFHGVENRSQTPYMGFELEVDTNHNINRSAVINRFKDDFQDFFHYEEDGSLRHGWENISQPASLSYHLEMIEKYKNMFEVLKDDDLRSHDTDTCGFHIHIDRQFFEKQQDTATAKLLYIFEKFRDELMIFSRRTVDESESWARSRKHSNNNKGWIKKAVKDSKGYPEHGDRYYAVNLTNTNTIEIRLWKGTLNIETFEATLKFTAQLAGICKRISAVELSKMTFDDLLGSDKVVLSYWHRINNN